MSDISKELARLGGELAKRRKAVRKRVWRRLVEALATRKIHVHEGAGVILRPVS